jgi:hypothetical protein
MFYTGLLKRIIPFFLTFAAGLFIASFFVTLSFPRFRPGDRRSNRAIKVQQMEMEIEQLREDKMRLLRENQELRNARPDGIDWDVPPTPAFDGEIPPPPPPPAPRAPRHR